MQPGERGEGKTSAVGTEVCSRSARVSQLTSRSRDEAPIFQHTKGKAILLNFWFVLFSSGLGPEG